MNATKLRIAVVAVLGAVLLVAVTALAIAAPPPGKGKGKVGAAQYAYGPAGKAYGKNKVPICHKGKTKMVPRPAVKGHMRHGDTLGAC